MPTPTINKNKVMLGRDDALTYRKLRRDLDNARTRREADAVFQKIMKLINKN
ncbi:hypothetical protein HPK19_05930 [Arthrobacter citreus]|nr:hypothetical protein HPK19_05930 [Arthrobacter citreus]